MSVSGEKMTPSLKVYHQLPQPTELALLLVIWEAYISYAPVLHSWKRKWPTVWWRVCLAVLSSIHLFFLCFRAMIQLHFLHDSVWKFGIRGYLKGESVENSPSVKMLPCSENVNLPFWEGICTEKLSKKTSFAPVYFQREFSLLKLAPFEWFKTSVTKYFSYRYFLCAAFVI